MTHRHAAPAGLLLGTAPAKALATAQPPPDTPYGDKRPSPTTLGGLLDLCATATSSGRYDQEHGVRVGCSAALWILYLAETPTAGRFICLPDPPITRQQARDRFLVRASAHPEFESRPAAVGLYRFTTSTFPCAAASTAAVPAPLAAPRPSP